MSQLGPGALVTDDYEEIARITRVLDDVLDGEFVDPYLLRFAGMFLLTLSKRLGADESDDDD